MPEDSFQTQPVQHERVRDPYPNLNFTVHEYHLNSVSPLRASQQWAVREGYNTIKCAISGDAEWKSMKYNPIDVKVKKCNTYMFNMVPPISLSPKETSRALKEWGSDATEDEVFILGTLDEFQCSDLRHIFRGAEITPYAATSSSNVAAKRNGVETSLMEREVEEKRLKIGSLFRVIPQPHLYPTSSDPKKRTINGQYARCKPTYIAPYTPETYPKDTRVGWVIPLRGSVPWSDCTSGEVLDTVAMPSPAQPGIKDQISWTQDAIVEFWYYLLQLRKGGSLGRLAISFHASKGHKHVPEPSNLAIGTSKVTGTSNVRHSPRNLSAVDFIKVYQDALDAPFVRNAIDVFRYQCAQEHGLTQQIRVLKGSRLALVDEFSQGILVL